jgi:hypothetical protein
MECINQHIATPSEFYRDTYLMWDSEVLREGKTLRKYYGTIIGNYDGCIAFVQYVSANWARDFDKIYDYKSN